MPNPSKYKSVGVAVDVYEKLVILAESQRRSLGQQLSLLIDVEIERLTSPMDK